MMFVFDLRKDAVAPSHYLRADTQLRNPVAKPHAENIKFFELKETEQDSLVQRERKNGRYVQNKATDSYLISR